MFGLEEPDQPSPLKLYPPKIFGLVEYSIPSPKQDYATWYRKNKKDHIRTARKIKGNLKRLGIKIDKRIIEHTIRRIKGRLSEEQVGGINIIKSIFT